MTRKTFTRALVTCALASALSGCPGELGDIQRYLDASRADGAAIDAPGVDRPIIDAPVIDTPVVDAPVIDRPVVDTPVIDRPGVDVPTCPNVEREIIARRCGIDGCHATVDPVAGLDLVSPNVTSRLVGVTSRCRATPLIAQGNPDGSFLFLKVSQPRPTCGRRMPSDVAPLSDAEIACVRTWVMNARRAGTP